MENPQFPRFNYLAAFTLTIATQHPLTQDIVVDSLGFANTDSADHSVTVTDGAGKTLLPLVTVAARSFVRADIPEGGYLFTAGIVLSASVDGKIDCWLRKRPC